MVEETTVTDADIARQEALRESIAKTNAERGRTSDVLDSLHNGINKTGTAVSKLTQDTKEAVAAFLGLKVSVDPLSKLVPSFDSLSTFIAKNSAEIERFGNTATRALLVVGNLIPRDAALFGSLGDAGSKAGVSIAESFKKLSPVLDTLLPSFLFTGFQRLAESADDIQNLELALYNAAASSGQLPGNLADAELAVSTLGEKVSIFNLSLYETAKANFTSIEAVAKFRAGIMAIPGALEATVRSQTELGATIDVTTAAMKIASAWGRDNAEVAQLMTNAYRDFGASADASVTLLARMGEVANELHLPFDLMSSTVMRTGESFKMFGDQSQAALNVMQAFGPSLERGGLGPKAVTELVGRMSEGIKNMDVAHKAFISGAAGGPGGLFGAFQIDNLLRQNKMDEVLRMTVQGMQRQLGGPVITLEQVMKQPALAGEFQKQISYLKDVAGLASTDQEAERILDALQSGSADKLKDIGERRMQTPTEALDKSLQRGNSLQEHVAKNTGVLVQLTRELQRQQQLNAEASFAIAKTVTGIPSDMLKNQAQLAIEGAKDLRFGVGTVAPALAATRAETEKEQGLRTGIESMSDSAKTLAENMRQTPIGQFFSEKIGAGIEKAPEKELAEKAEMLGVKQGREMEAFTAMSLAEKREYLKGLAGAPGLPGETLSPVAGRTATLPLPGRALAAPPEVLAPGMARGMGRPGMHPGAATPGEVIRVEVVLRDEHFRQIATGTTETVLKRVYAGAYSGKPTQ